MSWDGVTFQSTIKASIRSFNATASWPVTKFCGIQKLSWVGFIISPVPLWINFNQIVIIPKKRSHLWLFHPQTIPLRTKIKSRVKHGVWRKILFVTAHGSQYGADLEWLALARMLTSLCTNILSTCNTFWKFQVCSKQLKKTFALWLRGNPVTDCEHGLFSIVYYYCDC